MWNRQVKAAGPYRAVSTDLGSTMAVIPSHPDMPHILEDRMWLGESSRLGLTKSSRRRLRRKEHHRTEELRIRSLARTPMDEASPRAALGGFMSGRSITRLAPTGVTMDILISRLCELHHEISWARREAYNLPMTIHPMYRYEVASTISRAVRRLETQAAQLQALNRALASIRAARAVANANDVSVAEINALERTWGPTPPTAVTDMDDWSTDENLSPSLTAPNPSNIIETALHASRLLVAFSRAWPAPVAASITAVQRGQLTTALTSILTITREVRVHDSSVGEPLHPLPVADDVAFVVDSACIVCYARVADTLLVPCNHLMLCGVCVFSTEIERNLTGKQECCRGIQVGTVGAVMRCPVCRVAVRSTVSTISH